jgi:hypothetical protein
MPGRFYLPGFFNICSADTIASDNLYNSFTSLYLFTYTLCIHFKTTELTHTLHNTDIKGIFLLIINIIYTLTVKYIFIYLSAKKKPP